MAFNLGGLFSGVGAGGAFGPIGSAVGGLLGGFLGGGPKMPKAQRELLAFQQQIAQQLARYGNSIPGSDPGEAAALAQLHGLLGEQQRSQRDQYGAAAFSPGAGLPPSAVADLLANLSNAQVAQQQSLDSESMMNFLAQRRQALLQASGVGSAAGKFLPPETPGLDLAGTLGPLAQQYGYNKAYNSRYRQPKPGSSGGYITPLKKTPGSYVPGYQGPMGFLGGIPK